MTLRGEDPNQKATLDDHKRNQLTVLANCNLLTEGYDNWQVSCIIMARPTKSELLFRQMIGRGTRIQKGIHSLPEARRLNQTIEKEDCLVIDIVDNTSKHSLISLPAIFGLPPETDLNGSSAIRFLPVKKTYAPSIGSWVNKADALALPINARDVDLLNLGRWKDQLLDHSALTWFIDASGRHVLPLPEWDEILAQEIRTGQWYLEGEVEGYKIKQGPFKDLPSAKSCCEKVLAEHAPELWATLRSEAGSPMDKVSAIQKALLRNVGHIPGKYAVDRASTNAEIQRIYQQQYEASNVTVDAVKSIIGRWALDGDRGPDVFRGASNLKVNIRKIVFLGASNLKVTVRKNEQHRWRIYNSPRNTSGLSSFDTALGALLQAESQLRGFPALNQNCLEDGKSLVLLQFLLRDMGVLGTPMRISCGRLCGLMASEFRKRQVLRRSN